MTPSRLWAIATLLALGLSPCPASAAGGAPSELYNKSILVSWVQSVTQTGPDGRVVNPRVDQQRAIYVSSAGRIFLRATRSINNRVFHGERSAEFAPGQNRTPGGAAREMRFEGGKLIGTLALISGAGRIIVDFTPDYRGCSLTVIHAKQNGAPIVWKGLDGQIYQVQSINIASPTCSIQDGNVFAGN